MKGYDSWKLASPPESGVERLDECPTCGARGDDAALTSYDIDILSWLRRMLADESFEPSLWESSIAVLDKLLKGAT